MKIKYPLTECICIDVDGTLLLKEETLNETLATWAAAKKSEGYEVILWSARGRNHAENVAKKFNIEDNFSFIVSKPGYIIDDLGWKWIRYTKILRKLF